jgi:hypothetical protein
MRIFPSAAGGRAAILRAMPVSRFATVLVAAAGIAVAAGVGWLLHKEAKKRSEARALVSVVGDATSQLRDGLKTASPQALERIESGLAMAQRWSNPELVEAAEHYLVGAREIMRRRLEASRLTRKASMSRAALAAHMGAAGRRDSPWIRNAAELKKKVERDHFDLEVQLTALAELLEDLPQANKGLAPHVKASLLIEDTVRTGTREAVLEEAKRARAELAKTRALLPR